MYIKSYNGICTDMMSETIKNGIFPNALLWSFSDQINK